MNIKADGAILTLSAEECAVLVAMCEFVSENAIIDRRHKHFIESITSGFGLDGSD